METEVKIPLAQRAEVECRLVELGFRVSVPRQFEANDLYDTPDQSLRGKSMLLRLREIGDKSIITWKGPELPGPHKSRPELETTAGSVQVLAQILEQLGYVRGFRYEKYRTEYEEGQEHAVVTVDETPIGDFLEIEGEAGWIDMTAKRLGFSERDYILDSYGKLYQEYCKRTGKKPGDMVFESR
jgi:adenylate cyclase class 2